MLFAISAETTPTFQVLSTDNFELIPSPGTSVFGFIDPIHKSCACGTRL